MEASLSGSLRDLTRKIGLLAAQRDDARRESEALRQQVEDLRHDLRLMQEELHKRDLDIEYLRLSHKLADTPEALANARKTVKQMIADVDRVIVMLRDDVAI